MGPHNVYRPRLTSREALTLIYWLRRAAPAMDPQVNQTLDGILDQLITLTQLVEEGRDGTDSVPI